MQIETMNIEDLIPYSNNVKEHPQEQIEQIKQSILEFENNDPIAIDENNIVIEGHGRLQALKELGYKEVDVIKLTHLSEEQKNAYRLVHNKLTMNSDFDFSKLEEELKTIQNIDMSEFDFELNFEDIEQYEHEGEKKSLIEEFLIPPTSVFDSKQGYWQDRKRLWKELGLKSDIGRDDGLLGNGLNDLAKKII